MAIENLKGQTPAGRLARWPEEYVVREDEMGENELQYRLVKYLVEVLDWYYRSTSYLINANLNHYHPAIRNSQHLVVPDLAILKNHSLDRANRVPLQSWPIDPPERNPPELVFEISSSSTWPHDIGPAQEDKPALYGRIGVREYFAYDPNPTPVWRGAGAGGRRLLGWRYHPSAPGAGPTSPEPISPAEGGRLWSEELASWLAPEGAFLRLYDFEGRLRLTGEEAARAKLRELGIDPENL